MTEKLKPCPFCGATHSPRYTCEEAAAYRQDIEDEIAIYRGFYLGITPPDSEAPHD